MPIFEIVVKSKCHIQASTLKEALDNLTGDLFYDRKWVVESADEVAACDCVYPEPHCSVDVTVKN